jgi:TonB-dependent starch-binding outer membrane protein SusC
MSTKNNFYLSNRILYCCFLPLLFFILIPLSSALAQEATISGTILHERTDEPLIGANVLIEDTRFGAATNLDGEFTIRVPADRVVGQEITVIARFIGFRTERHRITLIPGTHEVDFRLREDVLGLDEVVVTGQAIGSSRREIGSAIASLRGDDLELSPIQNLSQMLQSRAPGVSIHPTSGQAGGGSRILLRGIASLSQSNTPIIYVDGVRIDNSSATGMMEAPTRSSGQAWSGLDDINPQDIESIEIVRGASAATMYGTEAAAGVIQVFTRRGMHAVPQWNYRSEYGWNTVPTSWWNDSGSAFAEWFSNTYSRNGIQQRHQLSVSGGTETLRFYVSGNYRNNQGVLPNNEESHYSFRTNVQATIRENLNVNANMSYTRRDVEQTPDGNNQEGITINALLGGPNGQFNPVAAILELEQGLSAYRFTGSLNIEYAPIQNFSHRLTGGVDYYSSDNQQFHPPETVIQWMEGHKRNYRRQTYNLNLDYIATFRTRVTSGIRSTSNVGFQGYSREVSSSTTVGREFAFFGLKTVSAAAVQDGGEGRFEEKSIGFFAEQQFGFNDLVYLTFGARADAHSAFGAATDYQLYPKVDVSYLISEHNWWNERWGSLRLRSSYGTAGMQPGAFDAIRTWTPVSAIGGQPAVTPNNVGNPDLMPEVSHEFEVGFDAGILRDRVNLEATYYYQVTKDALYFRGLSPSSGFLGTQLENIGEVENEGVEIGIRTTILADDPVRLSIFGNFHFNRNHVVTLGGGRPIITRWTQEVREGKPIASFYGDRWVESTDEDGNRIAVLYSTTLERDENGNLPENWDYIGPPQPTRTIQFGSAVTIRRNISLNILFDYQAGHFTHDHTARFLIDPRRYLEEDVIDDNGQLVATAGHIYLPARDLTQEDDPVLYQLVNTNSTLAQGDFVVPADFLKLREISIAYRIPRGFVRGFGISSATVNFSARNIWRWSKSDILEVEANLSGHSTHQRHSYFPTPTPQQYVFGLSLQF